jgi:catechol 2,3-dioxygenase-like lactoylglutathione lyase family enzyme
MRAFRNVLFAACAVTAGAAYADDTRRDGNTTAAVLFQPSMNVFRRFDGDADRMYEFYRDVLGFEQLQSFGAVELVEDPLFGTTKYPFRHGSTTINLRSFEGALPADTGSGGIQYVVSDVERVEELAKAYGVSIDQPVEAPRGAALRTIWLDDPDGVTNYFAETSWSRESSAAD